MSKKPLISICIPTYNRGKYLEHLLESIVSQKKFTETDDVEIVIDDGPSKDNTKELVERYQNLYKGKIRYYRNEKSVGMCSAFMEAISFSNGMYTWLFGSDDFMQENALEIVLSIIKEKSPKLILSNRQSFKNINECVLPNGVENKKFYFNGFSGFSQYMGSHRHKNRGDQGNYLTFISVFCFETEHYNRALEFIGKSFCSIEKLKENYFNFAIIVYSQLYSGNKICVVESPRLVYCQEDNHGWKPNKKIAQDLDMLLSYLKHNYTISKDCHKLFTKISRIWWFTCFVVPAVKDFLNAIGLTSLNNYLSRLGRNFFKK